MGRFEDGGAAVGPTGSSKGHYSPRRKHFRWSHPGGERADHYPAVCHQTLLEPSQIHKQGEGGGGYDMQPQIAAMDTGAAVDPLLLLDTEVTSDGEESITEHLGVDLLLRMALEQDDDDDHDHDDEDIDETGALSYSMASGLGLSASDSLGYAAEMESPATDTAPITLTPTKPKRKEQMILRRRTIPYQNTKKLHRKSMSLNTTTRTKTTAINEASSRQYRDRWSLQQMKKDVAAVTPPVKGRRFQKITHNRSFSRDGSDDKVYNAEERCAFIEFPALERVEADEPNSKTFFPEEEKQTNDRGIVRRGDDDDEDEREEDESFERNGIVLDKGEFTCPFLLGDNFLHPFPPPVFHEKEANHRVLAEMNVVSPLGEFFNHSPLGPDNEECENAADILLHGFSKRTGSPGRTAKRILGDGHDFVSPVSVRDDIQECDIASGGVHFPTNTPNAIHRFRRPKKNVTQKLTKSPEFDNTNEEAKVWKWAEKITRIATEWAPNSLQALSPLRGRRDQKLERLHSRDGSGDSQIFSLPSDIASENKDPPKNSNSWDISMDKPMRIRDTSNATMARVDPFIMSVSPVAHADDIGFDSERDANTEVSVFCESDAPDGTVWVKASSGCVRHLELSFD